MKIYKFIPYDKNLVSRARELRRSVTDAEKKFWLEILKDKKLEKFNAHRKELATYYTSQLQGTSFILPKDFADRRNISLRFVLRHPKAHEIIRKAWNQNFLIGDWYTSPVAPHDTRLDAVGYVMGKCPIAEKLAKVTFNLPTNIRITKKEADSVIQCILNQVKS